MSAREFTIWEFRRNKDKLLLENIQSMQCHLYPEMYFNQSSPHCTFAKLVRSSAAQWFFSHCESGGVAVALQPHQPDLSCSMSGIPTDLMHNLTCLVEASNLSCSQVTRRHQLITTALHAQIKTWLWAIRRNGWSALPAVCAETKPLCLEQDVRLAQRSGRACRHSPWPVLV